MMARLTRSLGLTLILSACGPGLSQSPVADSTEPVQLQVVYRGNRCAAVRPGVEVIRDTDSWAEWRRQQDRQFFPADDGPGDEETAIDFDRSTVIVISMGQKPTPGYAIEVLTDSAMLQGGSLNISSIWRQPAEDAILAQVLTSPCVAIMVSTTRYDTVKINDQQGDTVIDQRI